MISVGDLQNRIKAVFPNPEPVSSSALRGVRESNGKPFAVCYFDVGGRLPNTAAALAEYFDELVGPAYFKGPKSLQWSNYFYFVTTKERLASQEVKDAKKLIEADRRYARKYVIAEDQIDEVLNKTAIGPQNYLKTPNVFSIWAKTLSEAGLDSAIFSNDDLPTRLSKIEKSIPGQFENLPFVAPQAATPPFITSMELRKYRPYPQSRSFSFGTVNLIVGPNAAGKTSLLESIELYYCGRTKRAETKPDSYEIKVWLADETEPETVSADRELALFRERNLAWYGQSEVKTSNLYQSFAKFNFLDTDAAVNISESSNSIEDDLSKLLIGPDAAKTWQDIQRVSDALSARLRDLNNLVRQLDESLAEIVQRAATLKGAERLSETLKGSLSKLLERLNWQSTASTLDQGTSASLLSRLSFLGTLTTQASSLGWVPAPVTLERIARFISEANRGVPAVEGALLELRKVEGDIRQASDLLNRRRDVLHLLDDLAGLIDADLIQLHADRESKSRAASQLSHALSPFDLTAIFAWFNHGSASPAQALGELLDYYAKVLVSHETELEMSQTEYRAFADLKDLTFNLSQQLRMTADEILQRSENRDECPLCHTQFSPGELANHIHIRTPTHLDQAGEALLKRIQTSEIGTDYAKKSIGFVTRLINFCGADGKNLSLEEALSFIRIACAELQQIEGDLKNIEAKIAWLDSKGTSISHLEPLLDQLRKRECLFTEITGRALASRRSEFLKAVSDQVELIQALEKRRGQYMAELNRLFSVTKERESEFHSALSQLKERIAATESIFASLTEAITLLPWPQTIPLAELLVAIDAVQVMALQYRETLAVEMQAEQEKDANSERARKLNDEKDRITPTVTRFSDALATLEALKKDYSLHGAMEKSLEQNRSSIELIFARIHSPDEFAGLGSAFSTLRRRNGEEARLTEVSTGQRAALALSIFLSQNSQLAGAPPVILIDDPIAHIDDLNCLSFLDYLRDIAIEGKRQIFFATANDKIATLFERKFDFLGEQFCKIQLERD
jgi:DNA repair exonuclease SbcCD ATPase subunit